MKTEEIKMVQRGLSEVLNKELVDNGHYGHYTERMVKEFQEKCGAKIDGIFTENCWNILKGDSYFFFFNIILINQYSK